MSMQDEVQYLVGWARSSTAIMCAMQINSWTRRMLDEEHGKGYTDQHPEEHKLLVEHAVHLAAEAISGEKIADAIREALSKLPK